MRQLRSASFPEPSWLLLEPGNPRHQTLWTSASNQFSSLGRWDEIAQIRSRASDNNHPATRQSSWVAELVTLLPPAGLEAIDSVVLPIIHDHRLLAYLGWDRRGRRTTDFAVNSKRVRDVFRNNWRVGELEVENHALHWMLSCNDRPVACVKQDATIVKANSTATDLLMRLQYGPRHYFQSNPPRLPKALTLAIGRQTTGQIRLSEQCTARFEELPLSSVCAAPLVGIEFFLETAVPMVQPLSRLTAVERDVYALIVNGDGLTYREIAKRRGCAFATVKNQVSAVLNKLGVARRHQLLAPAALPAVQLRNPGLKGSTASIK